MKTGLAIATPEYRPLTETARIPGDLAMWCFILAELAAFGLLLISLAIARVLEPAVFSDGLKTVHAGAGLLNTLLLLTGSYLVARGIAAARRYGVQACMAWFYAGAASGAGYVFVKLFEYGQMIDAGYSLRSSTFHFFYLFTTFFHFMHVLLGMIILVAVARRCGNGWYDRHDLRAPESAASYWHMVDLVWLVLFPVLYVFS